ncbi:MAG TPA: von Willebrand factor type A domain-containing protein, partial [Chitinophaga sp.]|nr:von Willebrand factor type A domain-containing protein [Chitinophaga sp.]
MQKFLFLILAAFISLNVQAQRSIEGTVKDNRSHSPLTGAVVALRTGNNTKAVTNAKGQFKLAVPTEKTMIYISCNGYLPDSVQLHPGDKTLQLTLKRDLRLKDVKQRTIMDAKADQPAPMQEVVVTGYATTKKRFTTGNATVAAAPSLYGSYRPDYNTEDYSPINENIFHTAKDQPLSTFSIDVDRASYSNVRRYLNNGNLPPADAVRVEEMINYFDYEYKNPTGKDPVAIYADMANCPWNPSHQLVRIALKGKTVEKESLPASNLVFLIDVSGSMSDPNKLPLVKQALKALVGQLREEDKVAIAVYAGAAGLVLPSTSGKDKTAILDALDKLEAGGSTAGGAGILLAYKTAAENLLKNGNNRVILATDGDFNVGVSSDGDLQRIIETEREKGIFLSVLGFGMGNYKDNKLELLADKGNGNYAYIDNFEEARRTFVTEFGGTLFTIAKDVKLQIEFNPKYVKSYRLVGYENRMLNNEDFNDDKKDAGDMGAGHTVTALYEIIPA